MVRLIDRELKIAIEVRASLEIANSIIKQHADAAFYSASVANSVQGAQAMFLALTLAKLYEMPKPQRRKGRKQTHAQRYNRSDAASIPLLARFLKQKRAQKVFVAKARRWTPMLMEMADQHAADCVSAAHEAADIYRSRLRSPKGRTIILRLRHFRNNLLAHLLIDRGRRVAPTYHELNFLVDAAIAVMTKASLAVEGNNRAFALHEKEVKRKATTFWAAAIPAAIAAKPPARTLDGRDGGRFLDE